MHIDRRHILRTALALAGSALIPPARAQASYPGHPIQLVHGFGAGGNADVVARLMGQALGPMLGQPLVVEIKSGAGGVIASDFVSKSKPDGYTLLMLTGGHTASAVMNRKLPYDPVRNFTFLSTVSAFPFVIAVRADHPAKTLADLLALARKKPDTVTFTSVGVGSTQHMTGELLAFTAGVRMLHVPYRGGGAPVEAVLSGDVDVLCDTLTVAMPQIQSGKLRALAVTSAQAWPDAPDIPPVSATLPGFEVRSWLGLAAPPGLPQPIVDKLVASTHRALQDAKVQATLSKFGSRAWPGSPQAMRDMIAKEITRWRDVAAKAGIQAQ